MSPKSSTGKRRVETRKRKRDSVKDMDDDTDECEERSTLLKVWDTVKDIVIAFIIVVIIIGSIWIYTGNWPPVVVIESKSMQHSDTESFLSVIDTGDMVLVKSVESREEVTPYMEGKRIGYETYSGYGDVLIYQKNGYDDITPIIHRALLWVEVNTTTNSSFDIPELKHSYHKAPEDWYVDGGQDRWYDLSGSIVLKNIGHDHRDVRINLGSILDNYARQGVEPHDGFITLGDNNRGSIDQTTLRDEHDAAGNYVGSFGGQLVRPIKTEWIIGQARGELPWFGLIKLYFQDSTITQRAPSNSFTMLYISIILIFAVPISLDIVLILLERRRGRTEDEEQEEEDEFGIGAGEEPPPPEDFEEELPPPDDMKEELPPPDDFEEELPPPNDFDEEPPPPED
ncbi:MAG: S26 family signal peptidase [Thermoplasmata archaeon]|nr:MAG: S26 family signal peptidase [Thermoplasmata archaeon]